MATLESKAPPKHPVPQDPGDKSVSIQQDDTMSVTIFPKNLEVADGNAPLQENSKDAKKDKTSHILVKTPGATVRNAANNADASCAETPTTR